MMDDGLGWPLVAWERGCHGRVARIGKEQMRGKSGRAILDGGGMKRARRWMGDESAKGSKGQQQSDGSAAQCIASTVSPANGQVSGPEWRIGHGVAQAKPARWTG